MSEQQNQISVLAGALTTHQRHFGKMSTDDRQWAIQNTEAAISLFAEAVKNRAAPTEAKPIPLFSVIAETNLDALGEKKTAECFPKPRYVYRDGDFDNWLPATQSKTDACTIATLKPAKDWTFAEAAAKVLGIGAGTSVKLLGKALIENGHTTTLAQAEEMVDKTERGEETGMHTDGYGNFFFVETGNEDNPVSVGNVHRVGRDWDANVYSLDRGLRWFADRRLLVRNLSDASKL